MQSPDSSPFKPSGRTNRLGVALKLLGGMIHEQVFVRPPILVVRPPLSQLNLHAAIQYLSVKSFQ